MRCVKDSGIKNQIRQKTISKLMTVIVSILLILGTFSGCGSSNTDSSGDTTGTEEQTSENTSEEEENRTGLLFETAKDGLTSRSCRRKIRRSGDGFIFRERILTGRFCRVPHRMLTIRIIRQTDRKERRELFISRFPIRQTSVTSIP